MEEGDAAHERAQVGEKQKKLKDKREIVILLEMQEECCPICVVSVKCEQGLAGLKDGMAGGQNQKKDLEIAQQITVHDLTLRVIENNSCQLSQHQLKENRP